MELPFENQDRKLLVRKEAETSTKFGFSPLLRSVDELIEFGVVNIDKPKGPTSHQVSAYVQQILGLKKAGHSGTLDPKVTGVLPVALGSATRIVQALLVAGKEYVCLMHLHKPLPEDKIMNVLNSFIGKIKQLPPVKSAIKRQVRERKIYYLDVIEIGEQDVLFRVGCQAGTYIRKLCHDIGQSLGVGAHMQELRRTKAGPFDESSLVSMYDLKDAFVFWEKEGNENLIRKAILPVESAVSHLPKVFVIDTAVDTLCHGADLKVPGIASVESDIKEGDLVAVMTLKHELIAIGNSRMISKDMIREKRGVAVRIDKVFMRTGVYPKIEKS